MKESRKLKWKHAVKYGVILGLISVIVSLLVYITDFVTSSIWAGVYIFLITLIINFIALIFILKDYRDKLLNGYMKYGRGVAFSIILGLYSSIIIVLYSLLFNYVIDPDYQKNTFEKTQSMMYDYYVNMGMSEDQIDMIMERMEESQGKSPIIGIVATIPATIIYIVILSLIVSAFIKRNPDPYNQVMAEINDNDTQIN